MAEKNLGEKMKEFLAQSAQTSKELATKAGAKAQNLGEQGVLLLDIKKLKSEVARLTEYLGKEAYQSFVVRKAASISAEEPGIKQILNEIASTEAALAQKEAELQEKKGTPAS